MITSANNEKIKNIVKLLSNSKARRTQQAFVVEGDRIAGEIPPGRILECFVSESFAANKSSRLMEILGNRFTEGDYETVDDSVFRKMSDTQNPQGILCVVGIEQTDLSDFLSQKESGVLRLLILEGIQDPGNLGTMIRTAEGAGFDAVIADRNTADLYNPKVTRSTMGSMFRVPVIYTDNLPEAVKQIQSKGITTYAAHLEGENDFYEESYPERIGILIGNEGNGLSDEISEIADKRVKIPMKGKLESLNAAVAAALLMYEAGKC